MKHADRLNQPRRDGRGDQRAGAEAADRNAGNQSPAIREPLDKDSNRDDIGEAQADSADHSIAQIQPPQPMVGKAGQEDSNSIQDATGQRHDPRPASIQPKPTEERRYAQHEDADGKR